MNTSFGNAEQRETLRNLALSQMPDLYTNLDPHKELSLQGAQGKKLGGMVDKGWLKTGTYRSLVSPGGTLKVSFELTPEGRDMLAAWLDKNIPQEQRYTDAVALDLVVRYLLRKAILPGEQPGKVYGRVLEFARSDDRFGNWLLLHGSRNKDARARIDEALGERYAFLKERGDALREALIRRHDVNGVYANGLVLRVDLKEANASQLLRALADELERRPVEVDRLELRFN